MSENATIDHADLLRRYMQFVWDYDGSTYVSKMDAVGFADGRGFSADERAYLERLSDQIMHPKAEADVA